MISYDFFKKIEDRSNLAEFFNKSMDDIMLLRMACSPKTFNEMKELEEHVVARFYETCLWEMWMHGVIKRLRIWEKILDEYLNEYSGSWKYYALCKRKECIDEYGGEDKDYNEDGTVKMEGLTDEELIPYTVLKDLIPDDCSDIVCDSNMTDLTGLSEAIKTVTQIHIDDILNIVYGQELPSYIEDEEGDLREISLVEKALNKAVTEANGEESATLMSGIIGLICFISTAVKSVYNPVEDNVEQMHSLKGLISRILTLDSSLAENLKEILAK